MLSFSVASLLYLSLGAHFDTDILLSHHSSCPCEITAGTAVVVVSLCSSEHVSQVFSAVFLSQSRLACSYLCLSVPTSSHTHSLPAHHSVISLSVRSPQRPLAVVVLLCLASVLFECSLRSQSCLSFTSVSLCPLQPTLCSLTIHLLSLSVAVRSRQRGTAVIALLHVLL